MESHKHESAENGGAVRAALQDADNAVVTPQPLLSEVEKQHEALLAAGLKHSRHTQVDSAALYNSLPASHGVLSKEDLKVDFHRLPVLTFQNLADNRLSALLVESWVPMRGRLGLGDERLRAGREGTRACP